MNHFNLTHLVNGLVDLIVHLKLNALKNSHEEPLRILSSLDSNVQHDQNPSLGYIFSKLNGKLPNSKIQPESQIQVTFKLLCNETNSVLASEIWELQSSNCISALPAESSKQIFTPLKRLLRDVISTSNGLPQWRNHLATINQKTSNYSMTYQIISGKVPRTSTLGLNKTQFFTEIASTIVECRVYTSTPKVLQSSQNLLTSAPNRQRKQSISTIGSNSDLDTSPRSRRKSIYSYYDADTDVTFLSNNEFDLREDVQVESISYQREDQQDDDFELVLTEEDQKLGQFIQSLREFQYLDQPQTSK